LKGSPGKHDSLNWLPEHQQAFDAMKEALVSPQILHIPDPTKPIIVHSNWSQKAIGGWIGQEENGQTLPITYKSQKLRPAEKNYSPYDGELLALMHCLQTFRPYLIGRPIIVRSDQKALKWLLDQRTLSRRQYRWLDDLQTFDITLEWIPGHSNLLADILSRRRQDKDVGIQVNNIVELNLTFVDEVKSLTPSD